MSKNSATIGAMAHKILLAATFVGLAANASAQTTITLDIQQSFGPQAWLYRYDGEEFKQIDSCSVGMNGIYRFVLPADAPKGQYQMQIGRANTIDLLVHNEPLIAMRTTIFAVYDSLKILQSNENKVFVKFNRLRDDYKHKHKLLTQLQKLYPAQSPFGQTLQQEMSVAQEEFLQSTQPLADEHPELLAASYIHLDAPPHARWEGVNLNLPALLNTPIWRGALWRTVEQLQSDQLDKEQQDDRYAQLLTTLLGKPMADTMRYIVVGQLHSMFSESDYYTTIETLLRLGQPQVNTMEGTTSLKQRMNQERPLSIGAKATNFSFRTIDGQKLKLSQTDGRYKLLIFWSAWCPHCVEMLPELRQLYARYHPKGLEIVAVSVDVDDAQLPAFVRGNQLSWINTVLTSQNEDHLAKAYNIDGTPKMLLLDDKLRIASKPVNTAQLQVKLKQIFGE